MYKNTAGIRSAGNRDGPLIFHMRDGPPHVTGPPGGTGPPDKLSGSTGPPQTKDPPMEWLVRKKTEDPKASLPNRENKLKRLERGFLQEENIMKTSNRNRLIGLVLAGGFSLLGTTSAFAAAGDNIANRATLNYQVGGTAQTEIESGTGAGNSTPGAGNGTDTVFVEDRVLNFTVTRGGATASAIPGATQQWVEYTITNNSNAPQGFLLKGLNNADGTADPFGGANDSFDGSSVQTFVESGATGGFQPGEDTVAYVATLAAGATQTVYVVSTIPLNNSGGTPLVNGDVAVMTLVAQIASNNSTGVAADAITNDDNGNVSPGGNGFTNGAENVSAGTANDIADDPTTMQTVFNDAAGTLDGTGAADAAQNAQHSDNSSYTIQAAALTVTKASSALWDPVNTNSNPKSIPGGYVRYTISVANAAGAADAALTTLTDTLPASLDLDPDFTDGTAANPPTSGAGQSFAVAKGGTTIYCTAAADGDGCDYTGGAGGTVTVDLSNATFAAIMPLAGGETVTVNFNAIVQ